MAKGVNGCGTSASSRTGAAGQEATRAEVEAVVGSQYVERDWAFLSGESDTDTVVACAPRAALEAVLAAEEGVPEAAFAAANAHRSWSELFAQAHTEKYMLHDKSLNRIAVRIALGLRQRRSGRVWSSLTHRNRHHDPFTLDELDAIAARQGPGARSGVLADYTRAELCRLLGYLQREAKDLSDEQLRAMALDAHLVPRYRGAPSQVELAYRAASTYNHGRNAVRAFREVLRAPYGQVGHALGVGYRDEGERDLLAVLDDLGRDHPYLAEGAALGVKAETIRTLAERSGIPTRYGEDDLNQAEETQAFVSSLERRHGEALRTHLAGLGGGKLTVIVGHASDGQWRALKPGQHTLAFYRPQSGELHLGRELDELARKAEQGTATPSQRYAVAKSLAHELAHAASGGDGSSGYRNERSSEHTVEEGEAEAIGRLDADRLAVQLGFATSQERLRAAAANNGYWASYPRETETMVALAAACVGEFEPDAARAGFYREPEQLSPLGRRFLRHAHTRVSLAARARHYTQALAQERGCSEEKASETVQAALRESKSLLYSRRLAPSPGARAERFSAALAEHLGA